MDVHSRSAFHPLLGRLRIGAPRLWPLSPELHTSDCSFACPGSSTWVDKVPSRDTPYIGPSGWTVWCGPRQPSGRTAPLAQAGNGDVELPGQGLERLTAQHAS